MKILTDKIDAPPPHLLGPKHIKRITETVPHEWIKAISEVRLSNSLEMNSPWAFLSHYDGSLTIYSRRGTVDQALKAILSELAADFLGMNTRNRHRRSKAEENRLYPLIRRYIDELLPELLIVRKRLISTPDSSFRPVHLNNGNAQQTRPANPRPFGTSVMSPAIPASRAGATPEASGDS